MYRLDGRFWQVDQQNGCQYTVSFSHVPFAFLSFSLSLSLVFLCRRDKFVAYSPSCADSGHRPRIIGAPIRVVCHYETGRDRIMVCLHLINNMPLSHIRTHTLKLNSPESAYKNKPTRTATLWNYASTFARQTGKSLFIRIRQGNLAGFKVVVMESTSGFLAWPCTYKR
jgi:hypothetical protein